MKTLTFVLLIFAISSISFAQLKQYSLLLGGDFTISTSSEKVSGDFFMNEPETDMFTFVFYPQIGYFLFNNFAVGLRGRIGYSKITFDTTTDEYPETNTWTTNYSAGPFIRYYYPFSSFAIFLELNYVYGEMLQTYEQVNYLDPFNYELIEREINSTQSIFAPSIGLVFFANEFIGIEGAVSYETGNSKTENEGYENEADYDYEQDFNGFAFTVGLQIYLSSN